MIHQVVNQTSTKFKSLISHLCDSLGVSKKVETHEKNARIVSKEVKFQMIHQVVNQTSTKFKSLISHLCDSLGVSRSGYYRYFSSCAEEARLKRLKEEQHRLEVIQKAICFKGRKNKGIRQVAMVLKGEFTTSFRSYSKGHLF